MAKPVVERLMISERSEVLALVRRIRAELAEGPSRLRDFVVALERLLEAAQAGEEAETG